MAATSCCRSTLESGKERERERRREKREKERALDLSSGEKPKTCNAGRRRELSLGLWTAPTLLKKEKSQEEEGDGFSWTTHNWCICFKTQFRICLQFPCGRQQLGLNRAHRGSTSAVLYEAELGWSSSLFSWQQLDKKYLWRSCRGRSRQPIPRCQKWLKIALYCLCSVDIKASTQASTLKQSGT